MLSTPIENNSRRDMDLEINKQFIHEHGILFNDIMIHYFKSPQKYYLQHT